MVPPSLNNSKSSNDMPRWRHSRCSSWGSDAPSVLCTSVFSLCPPCPLHNTGRPQVRPREAEACQAPDRPCAGPSSRRAGGLGPLHRLHLLPPRPGKKVKWRVNLASARTRVVMRMERSSRQAHVLFGKSLPRQHYIPSAGDTFENE